MKQLKKVFDTVVGWDREQAKRLQNHFKLTDYQMLCISFAKGFLIAAVAL
tara:strand:- start:568 stop:717 length:150 start_codon:yes stop_codon:yes gene_type:complete